MASRSTLDPDLIRRSNPSDEYELVQRVGGGTFGEVYKARHLHTGDFAAVKVVKLEPGDDFALIQQEIIMMKDCGHPNIVSYYGSYLRSHRLWIVMEYCGGGSLQDIYHMTGALTELQIAFVVRETLKGINYLHGMGKIHRDIKGANILLTTLGEVKLADFGVAAQITATIGKRKSFIGTPYWMAPEVACVDRKGGYNQMCDVWAVGITAIEMAELQPPWFELHPMRVLYLMTKSSYKAPTLRDKIKWSPHFHDFVKSCLVKNPKKRPTPEKLLANHAFLQGNLSSRLTRDLLDRVNNPSGSGTGLNFRAPDEPPSSEDEGPSNNNGPKRIPSQKEPGVTPRVIKPVDSSNEANGNVSQGWNLDPESIEDNGETLWESISQTLTDRGHEPIQRKESAEGQVTNGFPRTKATPPDLIVDLKEFEEGFSGSDEDTLRHDIDPKKMFEHSTTMTNESREGTPLRERCRDATPEGSGIPIPPNLSRFLQGEPCYCRLLLLNPMDPSVQLKRGETRFRSSDSDSYMPPVPPHRRRKKVSRRGEGGDADESESPKRNTANFGLPPTPKVTMGAGYSTIFHGCPLRINCTVSWTHPDTKDQHILLGTEEGIYSLNLTQLHDAVMDRIHPRRCSWLYVIKDVLMAVQGKTPHVYRHELVALHQRDLTNKISLSMNKVPEKWVPRKLAITTRIQETRGCLRCCVQRNPYNGYCYLAAAVPSGVVLMQWYDPLGKFLILKQVECRIPLPLNAFELLITTESEYPIVCTGVRKGPDRKHLIFDLVNLSHHAPWVSTEGKNERFERLEVTAMRQLEKDVVVVCYNNKVQVTNLKGRLKSSRHAPAELRFPFRIESVVCLSDSILAFHRFGMQGRSFLDNQLTQDISDASHVYRVLGSEKAVVLESRAVRDTEDGCNLCILAGHESTL